MGIKHGSTIRLYLTESESCSYLDKHRQRMLIVDPLQQIDISIATQLSSKGFRRSGNMIYRPNCTSCSKCISARVPVDSFKPSRSQKRVIKNNQDLEWVVVPMSEAENYFDLYLRYQKARHPEGIMYNPNIDVYKSFIESDVASSYLMIIQSKETKQPYSVTVVDKFLDGLSAVYTFFDPEFSNRSLGTNAVIELINLASEKELKYVYLGFWIEECSKMSYKTKFKPIEGYINGEWRLIK